MAAELLVRMRAHVAMSFSQIPREMMLARPVYQKRHRFIDYLDVDIAISYCILIDRVISLIIKR